LGLLPPKPIDVDSDGENDYLIVNKGTTQSYLLPISATTSASGSWAGVPGLLSIPGSFIDLGLFFGADSAAQDVNGDGIKEIVTVTSSGIELITLSKPPAELSSRLIVPIAQLPFDPLAEGSYPSFVDVTGDSVVDIVIAAGSASGAGLTGNGVTVVVDGRFFSGRL
jgi:hypothetical protein